MKEEIFNELKGQYLEMVEENERRKRGLKALKQKRNSLLNTPIVQHYLEVESQIFKCNKLVLNDKEIMDSTLRDFDLFSNNSSDDEEFNIYLYLGSFLYYNDDQIYQVEKDKEVFDYNIYGNIETKKMLCIDYEDCDAFEANNHVIINSSFPNDKEFYEFRNEYFKEAFNTSQEKAYQKFLKRTR